MSIPGVGLDERRRNGISCRQRIKVREDSSTKLFTFYDTDLDPSTSEARTRLEQRLGYSGRLSRRCVKDGDIGKISGRIGALKYANFSALWCFFSKDSEQICAVCLDTCYGDVETMVLKCSHKYHSKCLIPWLESHSNCPYCRNPV